MPIRKTHINRNRTLLILLGILLACILTLNASSFYSAQSIAPQEPKVNTIENPSDLNGTIHSAGVDLIQTLAKKFTSLK